jgi:hypothetical protein
MSEYDLSGLSTRSFEKLVQALALKVIGPNVVIFGDGPDGGREATFDGPIPYPSAQFGWNGYGVIQAKFRQRTKDKVSDGDWALHQLRTELKKISSTTGNLRKPEYYIFATNVVLTPVNETGWKDKAIAVIQSYSRSIPLKGFDIWDYDKITSFLDGFEDIRHRYAAWITSGDVLSQVIEWLKPKQPNFERIIHNFLQKELLTDQFANLEQAGHIPEDHVPLASVFVDLPVANQRQNAPPIENAKGNKLPPGYVSGMLTASKDRLAREEIKAEESSSHADRHHKREPGRYVLIGGPGQGKTTLGQFICQLFRAAILKDRPEGTLSAEVGLALKEIYTQCSIEGIELLTIRRFPVRIQLSHFASFLAAQETPHAKSLLSFIISQIKKRTNQNISTEDFQMWLGSYPWIIILDGLDEVPASSNRDEVLAAVRDFWIDAADFNADIMVIATTRPQGYNDDFSPSLYQHHWLTPLSAARAIHYAHRLVVARYAGNQERQEKILNRLKRASQDNSTSRMMRSPLQVTIMATLVDRIGQPPQERWSLFKEFYDVIYNREVERDIPAADILRNHRPDIDAIHTYVGLLLQVESEQTGQTDARLSAERFANVVHLRLEEEGHVGSNLEHLKSAIIEAATSRLVFLVGLETDAIGFEIRSLQEYMAAEGLMSGDDLTTRKRLRLIAPIINWRNVFLFAAGKCFVERQHLRDIVLAICAELNEDQDDEIAQSILAGSQLALELLEDGPARRQPKYTESLTRLAMRLLEIPDRDYHVRLAFLYEHGLDRVYKEELERRLLVDDPDKCSGTWSCLISLASKYPNWMEVLSTYWPDTADKQIRLLTIAHKINQVSLLGDKFIKSIPDVVPLSFYTNSQELYSLLDKSESARDELKPLWVRALADTFNKRKSVNYHLNLSHSQKVFLFFRPFTFKDSLIEEFSYLRHMPAGNLEWTPLIAGARFAANPSAETLAVELRNIANNYFPRSAHWLAPRVPWPLGACLGATNNESQLLQLADKADAGHLGDIDKWSAAEDRWLDSGINISDVQYVTDDKWPFDSHIDRYGFPFVGCDTNLKFRVINTESLKTLLEFYTNMNESQARAKVASWVLLVLSSLIEDGQTKDSSWVYKQREPDTTDTELMEFISDPQWQGLLSISEGSWVYGQPEFRLDDTQLNAELLKKLIDDSQRYGVALGALTVIPHLYSSSEKWKYWLDQIGHQFRLHHAKSVPQSFIEVLAQAYRSEPTLTGILKILSLFTRVGTSPTVPYELVQPNRFSSFSTRADAILVALSQQNLSKEVLLFLAQQVSELSDSLPSLAAEALYVGQQHRIDQPHFVEFIIALKKTLPTRQWYVIGNMLRFLYDSYRRRTSELRNFEVWEHLNLPHRLRTL